MERKNPHLNRELYTGNNSVINQNHFYSEKVIEVSGEGLQAKENLNNLSLKIIDILQEYTRNGQNLGLFKEKIKFILEQEKVLKFVWPCCLFIIFDKGFDQSPNEGMKKMIENIGKFVQKVAGVCPIPVEFELSYDGMLAYPLEIIPNLETIEKHEGTIYKWISKVNQTLENGEIVVQDYAKIIESDRKKFNKELLNKKMEEEERENGKLEVSQEECLKNSVWLLKNLKERLIYLYQKKYSQNDMPSNNQLKKFSKEIALSKSKIVEYYRRLERKTNNTASTSIRLSPHAKEENDNQKIGFSPFGSKISEKTRMPWTTNTFYFVKKDNSCEIQKIDEIGRQDVANMLEQYKIKYEARLKQYTKQKNTIEKQKEKIKKLNNSTEKRKRRKKKRQRGINL